MLAALALAARGVYVAVRDACAESPSSHEDDPILGDAYDDDDDDDREPNLSHGYVPALPTT